MPDYIYLLENRLSADQKNALRQLREATREAGMILFLTGDAVRDLTSGHAVRELEIAVHGNALELKNIIEKLGGRVWGEDEASSSLYLCFQGTVRVDVISTHRTEYPKPGKPVFHQASIQEDLRRRDFTANAMAISLNEGSFGLLMDPMNGAADIEARTLRLVSNYGFLEEPSLLIRATRYMARLGWELDAKTQTRYENAKGEGVVEFLSAQARSQELEQIGHEEEGLKVLQALEAEGWMKILFPAWTAAKADEEKLNALHDLAVQLLLQGVHADMSAAQMQLLTARLASKELVALKKLMLRPGFVEEWNSLDALATGFAKVLLAKENRTPSINFKLFTSYDPEAILWLGFTSKDPAVLERFNLFLKVWPEARQRIPHALMQEMRITPELATYHEIVESIFLELIDDRLTTPEEIRTFLEPHSPPAPPPQVTIKRPRAKRGADAKLKEHFDDDEEESEDGLEDDEDLDDIGGEEDEIDLGMNIPKIPLEIDPADEGDDEEDEVEPGDAEPVALKKGAKSSARPKPAKDAPALVLVPSIAEKPVKNLAPAAPIAAKLEQAEKPQAASKHKAEAKHAPVETLLPVSKPEVVAAKTAALSGKTHAAPLPPTKPSPLPVVKKAPPALVAAQSGKGPQQAATKSVASKGPSKAPVKAPIKVPIKAPVKIAARIPAKTPVKAPVKPPAKVAAKAPVKAPAVKSAPAKGRQVQVASSKSVKASTSKKPSAQTTKKAAPKIAKKR